MLPWSSWWTQGPSPRGLKQSGFKWGGKASTSCNLRGVFDFSVEKEPKALDHLEVAQFL